MRIDDESGVSAVLSETGDVLCGRCGAALTEREGEETPLVCPACGEEVCYRSWFSW